jgi:hypothetical protein
MPSTAACSAALATPSSVSAKGAVHARTILPVVHVEMSVLACLYPGAEIGCPLSSRSVGPSTALATAGAGPVMQQAAALRATPRTQLSATARVYAFLAL